MTNRYPRARYLVRGLPGAREVRMWSDRAAKACADLWVRDHVADTAEVFDAWTDVCIYTAQRAKRGGA